MNRGGLRASDNVAIDESGLLGTHRRCTNISRWEIIFLIIGILATIATIILTIFRFTEIDEIKNPDVAYGALIIITSIFLLVFLITGIFQQRITDIIAFFISAVMLTIYVITHFVVRRKDSDDGTRDATIRLVRLILTIAFNIIFIPLSIIVIRDYQRDEFSKRLFGAFPTARRPLKIYNMFDCVARINTMLTISTLILNLYNFNDLLLIDEIFLGVGICLAFIWLFLGIFMVRLENRRLFIVFCIISLVQPAFLGYCLYSILDHSTSTTTIITTSTTTIITTLTSTTMPSSSLTTTTMTSSSLTTSTISSTTSLPSTTSAFLSFISSTPKSIVPVHSALYVCMATNLVAHLLSIIFAILCVRNFGKGLKERVFNNRFDKYFQGNTSDA